MVFGFFGFCAALQLLGLFLVRFVPASHQDLWDRLQFAMYEASGHLQGMSSTD